MLDNLRLRSMRPIETVLRLLISHPNTPFAMRSSPQPWSCCSRSRDGGSTPYGSTRDIKLTLHH